MFTFLSWYQFLWSSLLLVQLLRISINFAIGNCTCGLSWSYRALQPAHHSAASTTVVCSKRAHPWIYSLLLFGLDTAHIRSQVWLWPGVMMRRYLLDTDQCTAPSPGMSTQRTLRRSFLIWPVWAPHWTCIIHAELILIIHSVAMIYMYSYQE